VGQSRGNSLAEECLRKKEGPRSVGHRTGSEEGSSMSNVATALRGDIVRRRNIEPYMRKAAGGQSLSIPWQLRLTAASVFVRVPQHHYRVCSGPRVNVGDQWS
jgi:hypothetical protein